LLWGLAMLIMQRNKKGLIVMQNCLSWILGVFAIVSIQPAFADTKVFLDKREILLRDLADERFMPPGLLAKFRQIEVSDSGRFQKPLGATRLSAFADPKNKKIYLNENATFDGDLNTLILHESLIASGLQDTNYEYSMLIVLLLKDSKSPYLDAGLREKYRQTLRSIPPLAMVRYKLKDGSIIDKANGTLVAYSEGGGVVLVGGGGDLRSAQIKEMAIKQISKKLSQSNPDFLKRHFGSFVIGTKIEAWKDPSNSGRVRMKAAQNPARKIYERIFYVPNSVSVEKAADLIYYAMVHIGFMNDFGFEVDIFIPRGPFERMEWNRDRSKFTVKKHQK
jgi:hypothetical protein